MDWTRENDLLGALHLPVVVCKNTHGYPLEYMNLSAELLFAPSRSVDALTQPARHPLFYEVIRCTSADMTAGLLRALRHAGRVDSYPCELAAFDGKLMGFSISANVVSLQACDDYVIFFFAASGPACGDPYSILLVEIINAALLSDDTNQSIETVIAMAGQRTSASRVYIFEEISPTATQNSYEWCAAGVAPAIQDLQNLNKADYNYDVIVKSGLYIANDVATLPDNDRTILQAQGIQALAIIAFYDGKKPLGYVGFDDCLGPREWKHDEIHFLQTISRMLGSLIKRRNAEEGERQNASLLQLVSDNSDTIIYVTDVEDHSILFVNRALAERVGQEQKDILGKKCWEVFHLGMDAPCDFCPIPKITIGPKEERSEVYQWEHYNSLIKRTYLVKDMLIRWKTGRLVHVETATDISPQKEYERSLKTLASMDAMTGIYNREWGGTLLQKKLAKKQPGYLFFIDLDGLKRANDTLGHKAGDEMLIETVRMIQENISGADMLCRWGGDEFLVWTKGTRQRAESTMESILHDVALYNRDSDKLFVVSFSYGLVKFSGASFDTLISEADKRMYDAKMEKRGRKKLRRRDDPIDERLV